MCAFNLETCARPNILQLEPYRCARDDYKDDGTNVLLDANENAFGPGLPLSANGTLAAHPSSSSSSSSSGASNGVNGTKSAAAASPSSSSSLSPTIDLVGLNRYPDPHQNELKQLFCDLRNTGAHSSTPLTPANMFVGVGSDEAIDAILRTFCAPGRDRLLTCPPTYGMYGVSAHVNDVAITRVPLDTSEKGDFNLRPDAVCEALAADARIKAAYICSPGNPTGNVVRKEDVRRLLEHPTWNGVVVVDEAYVDFADDPAASLATWVPEWPNLIVMQTLSKGFGLAGLRVGVTFSHPAVATLLNSLKAPYNVSSPSSALAIRALQPDGLAVMHGFKARVLEQKARLMAELPKIDGVGKIRGGKAANFILVEMLGPGGSGNGEQPSNEVALAVYERMAEQRNVVVRFRGKEEGCLGCLRVTVGTEREVDKFLADLKAVLQEIRADSKNPGTRKANGAAEEKAEVEANDIVA